MAATVKWPPSVHKSMVKQILAALVLLMLLPMAAAEQEAQRTHVHDRYEVVITADVVLGFGVDIQQLGWLCDVVYDAVLPDSDESNTDQEVSAYVGVTCSGPGTVLFSSGTPATVDAVTLNAPDACTVVEDFETAGASSTTRYVTAGYLVSFDQNSSDQDKCTAQLLISNSDTGEEWQIIAPITIYNDDAQPSGFESVIGANALEFLLFWIIVAMAVFFWSRSKDEVVQIFMALLLMFAGAIAISLYAAWIGWVPMGLVIAVLGAYMLIRTGMEAYQR